MAAADHFRSLYLLISTENEEPLRNHSAKSWRLTSANITLHFSLINDFNSSNPQFTPFMTQLEDQAQTLPRNTLFLSLACLTASLFVSFLDQTAVTTAIPSISASLGDARTISSWVGSSYLIANTNFQLLYGRLSDISGRNHMFL